MVNNVIGVVNYVIAARPSLLNFMIADTWTMGPRNGGPVVPYRGLCKSWPGACRRRYTD